MSRLFLRQCSVSLTGSTSLTVNGGGSKDLRVEFLIGMSTLQSPNPGRIRIYNPAPQTITAFQNKEFKTITLTGGYSSNAGQLYSGDIKQSLYAHDNAVDAYIDIFAGEGQNAYQKSTVTKTLSAGWTPQDKVNVALQAMQPYGVTGLGTVNVDLSQPQYPRGRPFVGMARDLLRQVALSAGATWSISQGKVNIIDHTKPQPSTTPIVLNSQTGLVDFPRQTENGIIARCLINPAIIIGTLVQIDESVINQAEAENTLAGGYGEVGNKNMQLKNTGKVAGDGLYHVIFMETSGDTRGQDWYQTLTCLATTATFNDKETADYIGPEIPVILDDDL